MSPDAARIDHYLCAVLGLLARLAVENLHTHNSVLLADKVEYLMIRQHLRAVSLGVEDVGGSRRNGSTEPSGNAHRANHRRIGGRFEQQSLLGVDDVGTDSRGAARIDELRLEFEPVLGQRDEQSVRLIDAVDAMRRRIIFSRMHSSADSRSVTA